MLAVTGVPFHNYSSLLPTYWISISFILTRHRSHRTNLIFLHFTLKREADSNATCFFFFFLWACTLSLSPRHKTGRVALLLKHLQKHLKLGLHYSEALCRNTAVLNCTHKLHVMQTFNMKLKHCHKMTSYHHWRQKMNYKSNLLNHSHWMN